MVGKDLVRSASRTLTLIGTSVGWNIVTGYLDSAARNLGHTQQPEHDERYRKCEELGRGKVYGELRGGEFCLERAWR